jgi:hypothetical protein
MPPHGARHTPVLAFKCNLAKGQGLTVGIGALPDGGQDGPNPNLLSDDRLTTDRIRASGYQHPVQHRHADGRLGLLGRKAASTQPWSDQRLVAAHSDWGNPRLCRGGCQSLTVPGICSSPFWRPQFFGSVDVELLLSSRLRKGPFEGPATVKPPALPEDIYCRFY